MMHKNLNLVLRFPKKVPPSPLVSTVQYITTETVPLLIYCNHNTHWELEFMLIKTLQATQNLALVPKNQKTSPHLPLGVKYIILNIKNTTPPPLILQSLYFTVIGS